MTGEECFKIGMMIKNMVSEDSLVEAEKYFKQGAYDFKHPKCMLKAAEITQDEGEKNFYYELAADYGESDAIHWIIEDFLTKKNYEEARTKFESYKEHLSSDCKTALQDKITFEMLKDKSDKGTISTEEIRVLANHYESGTGTEKNLQEAKELQDLAKFLETSASAEAGNVESIFQLGRMYFHGEGTKRNLDKAQDCFEKADKAGIPNESERLKAYEEFLSSLSKDNAPESQRQQVASRISTLKQKMEFDNLKLKPESELTVKELRKLAECYADGRFVKQDNDEAKELNNLADFKENKSKADENDSTACYEVAKMYLEGRGVKKNVHSAKHYIDKYRAKMPEAYDKLYELYDLLSKVLKEMANKAHTQANNMYNMYQATFITHKHSPNQPGQTTLNDLPSIHID